MLGNCTFHYTIANNYCFNPVPSAYKAIQMKDFGAQIKFYIFSDLNDTTF